MLISGRSFSVFNSQVQSVAGVVLGDLGSCVLKRNICQSYDLDFPCDSNLDQTFFVPFWEVMD